MQLWTVEEAREYLPRLRQLLALVQGAARPADQAGMLTLAPGSEHAEAALAELAERGVILRQLGAGLVDFASPGPDGELRLLCWHVDEPDIAWWHRPEDGFAGRQPLPG